MQQWYSFDFGDLHSYICIFFQVRAGKVYATATEDMDALTFGSNVLLRHLTFSEARKMPIQEIYLDKVLEGLKLTQNEVLELIFSTETSVQTFFFLVY